MLWPWTCFVWEDTYVCFQIWMYICQLEPKSYKPTNCKVNAITLWHHYIITNEITFAIWKLLHSLIYMISLFGRQLIVSDQMYLSTTPCSADSAWILPFNNNLIILNICLTIRTGARNYPTKNTPSFGYAPQIA